jgi:hypothetical protein
MPLEEGQLYAEVDHQQVNHRREVEAHQHEEEEKN